MEGREVRELLLLERGDYLERACSIVADLAHAGGPCPDPTLAFHARRRAEILVKDLYEVKQRRDDNRRKRGVRVSPAKVIHLSRLCDGEIISAVCSSHITVERGFSITSSAGKVSCKKCRQSAAWRKGLK